MFHTQVNQADHHALPYFLIPSHLPYFLIPSHLCFVWTDMQQPASFDLCDEVHKDASPSNGSPACSDGVKAGPILLHGLISIADPLALREQLNKIIDGGWVPENQNTGLSITINKGVYWQRIVCVIRFHALTLRVLSLLSQDDSIALQKEIDALKKIVVTLFEENKRWSLFTIHL